MIDNMLKTEYDGCGKCWVGVRRLSRVTDRTSSPGAQEDLIREATDREGGHIIAWADDWEVSGAVNPLDRPQFGPWLRNELGPYDGIVSAAVDRIGRNQLDVLMTGKLLHDTGKKIITHSHYGPWDLEDESDELRFSMESLGAQIELRAIQKRNRNATKRMRRVGRPKNKNSYGYKYVRLTPGGQVDHVELDEVAAEIIRNVAERILSATDEDKITASTEAARLTRAGVPNPSDRRAQLYGRPTKGLPWRAKVLIGILTSEAALGYLMHNGKPVADENGESIRLAEPLWDRATMDALTKKLAPKRRASAERAPKSTALLTGIAFCGNCGRRLYINGAVGSSNSNGPVAYACRARMLGLVSEEECKPSPTMSVRNLNNLVEAAFLEKVGTLPLYRRIYDPGTGHASRILDLEADRARLQADRDAGLYDEPEREEWFRARTLAMTTEIRQLKALPERPAGMYWHLTGETVADQWRNAADDAARRELLSFYDFRVVLFPRGSDVRVSIHCLDATSEDEARRASWEAHQAAIETEQEMRERDQADEDAANALAIEAVADEQARPLLPDAAEEAAGLWVGRPSDNQLAA